MSAQDADWARAALAQVKVNHARLAGCPQHHFVLVPSPSMLRRFRCAHCEGEVDAQAREWYERGLRHAAYVR